MTAGQIAAGFLGSIVPLILIVVIMRISSRASARRKARAAEREGQRVEKLAREQREAEALLEELLRHPPK